MVGRAWTCRPQRSFVRHDLTILDGLEPLIKHVEAELARQSNLPPWDQQAAFLMQLPGVAVTSAAALRSSRDVRFAWR
jgi:hypothetical protein